MDIRRVGAVELVDAHLDFTRGALGVEFLDQLHDLLDRFARSVEQQRIGSGDRSDADPAQLGVGSFSGDGLVDRFGHRLGHSLAQQDGLEDRGSARVGHVHGLNDRLNPLEECGRSTHQQGAFIQSRCHHQTLRRFGEGQLAGEKLPQQGDDRGRRHMLEGHRANAPDEISFGRQQTRGDVLDGLPLDGIARDQDPRLGVVRDQDKVRGIAGHLQAIDDQRAKAGDGLGGRTLRDG